MKVYALYEDDKFVLMAEADVIALYTGMSNDTIATVAQAEALWNISDRTTPFVVNVWTLGRKWQVKHFVVYGASVDSEDNLGGPEHALGLTRELAEEAARELIKEICDSDSEDDPEESEEEWYIDDLFEYRF